MEKLNMHTTDYSVVNAKKIAQLFPECVTEVLEGTDIKLSIDFNKLKQLLASCSVEPQIERYQFTWPEKKNMLRDICSPSFLSLRPKVSDSIDFDNTGNVYIEGDNLDALKLLRETYLGKIKTIIIDPPYNTGEDFVYNDDFAESAEDFLHRASAYDDDGRLLLSNFEVNTEKNGRFHSLWLNMIYSRIKLAKDLLSNDGAIFITIDDGELFNLKKVCDEIFGASNYVNTITLKMKTSAGASGGGEDKRLKKNCEYVLIYAKNYSELKPFSGVYDYTPMSDVVEQYRKEGKTWHYTSVLVNPGKKELVGTTQDGDGNEIKVFKRNGVIIRSINQLMSEEKISEKEVYKEYGQWIFEAKDAQSSIRTRVIKAKQDLSLDDDVVSIEYVPKTGKNKGRVYEQFYKGDKCRLFAWLRDISEVIDGQLYKKDIQGTFWDLTSSMNNLSKEGEVIFHNGKKPVALFERFIEMMNDPESIVLDFFSGSATTGHAVMSYNHSHDANCKFILVQLPEPCPEGSDEYNEGFRNICELGRARLVNARKEFINSTESDSGLFSGLADQRDYGFRVFSIDSSNMQDVYYRPEESSDATLFEDNIKPDRTSEDLLFQVLLECNIPLSAKIKTKKIAGKEVFSVNSGYLIACFDTDVNEELIKAVAKMKPYYFILRDSSLSEDKVADNFDQIFQAYSKETIRRVL